MKILWFTWKDLTHPLAGGAEVVNERLAKRLVADGHSVTLVVGGYKNAISKEIIDGYTVIRLGNRVSLYFLAYRYYKKHLRGWADLVIDEMNTLPFFAKFYVKEKNIMLAYMLCRKIWFYQLPPFLGIFGYLAEPIYLRMLSNKTILTESQSTKNELISYGFHEDRVHVFRINHELKPLQKIDPTLKEKKPTILSLGALRPMKRTSDQVTAFEIAKKTIPNLQMKIAGDANDPYGQTLLQRIAKSPFAKDIQYLGRVPTEEKQRLMQSSHLIFVTSVKEGWGLIVTEAASQGTPAIAYDVDGLRDSVIHQKTGLICPEDPAQMAACAVQIIQNKKAYSTMQSEALSYSKTFTSDASYNDFISIITKV